MSDIQRDRNGIRAAVAVLATIAILVAADLLLDDRAGAEPVHLWIEAVMMAVSAGGAIWLWATLRRTREEKWDLQRDVASAREEALRWRAEARDALRGLGVSIGHQFDRWQLTPAEREVALLLLKGLSHREVARVRDVSERTARQQAREVYRKADLSGRSELAAFFLEDLLVPPGGDPGPPGSG